MKFSSASIIVFLGVALANPLLEIRQTQTDCSEGALGFCCTRQTQTQQTLGTAQDCVGSAALVDCKDSKLYYCCGLVESNGRGQACVRKQKVTTPVPCSSGTGGYCCSPQSELQFLENTGDTCVKSTSSSKCMKTKKGYCCASVNKQRAGTGCKQQVF